jgi:uncharacterized phage protein (TIGR02218 family)
MRTIDTAFATHLGGDVTTVCHAWRVTLADGAVLGFTEHDRDLNFASTLYRAASGFSASEAEEASGLSAETSDVAGGFSSEAITEVDLVAGRYDGAKVEVYLVNWAAPDQHLLLRVQEIGDVRRTEGYFSAELRSFAHKLSRPQGRTYNRRCDATLGDARCGVDLTAYRAAASVVTVVDAAKLVVAGVSGFATGFFRQGVARFPDGTSADIDDVTAEDDHHVLTLWLPLAVVPAEGSALTLTAGCDKAFSTCKAKFANHLNFRGFPHMPGSDFAYSYAMGEANHDGGVLFE